MRHLCSGTKVPREDALTEAPSHSSSVRPVRWTNQWILAPWWLPGLCLGRSWLSRSGAKPRNTQVLGIPGWRSQKSGPSVFLASTANPSLPVFSFCIKICVYLQYIKLPPRSFFNSFTCTLASWAALFVVFTSHTIQFQWPVFVESLLGCLEHLTLLTEEEEKWRTDHYQLGSQDLAFFYLFRLPPSVVRSRGKVLTQWSMEPIHTSSWKPVVKVSGILQAGCIKN